MKLHLQHPLLRTQLHKTQWVAELSLKYSSCCVGGSRRCLLCKFKIKFTSIASFIYILLLSLFLDQYSHVVCFLLEIFFLFIACLFGFVLGGRQVCSNKLLFGHHFNFQENIFNFIILFTSVVSLLNYPLCILRVLGISDCKFFFVKILYFSMPKIEMLFSFLRQVCEVWVIFFFCQGIFSPFLKEILHE